MMSLYMHDSARQAVNRSIFIGGNARSGTSILGKIIYSMAGVEYAFEPPVLFALLPQIQSLSKDQFQSVFEAYCFEELLLGAISGRALNFNRNDDSCVFIAKSEEEVAKRLETAWTKSKQMEESNQYRLCIKMPDMGAPLELLANYYPEMKIVTTWREANPVIDSILRKNWYSNKNLQEKTLIWPSQSTDGILIPYWVEQERVKDWLGWSELERAGYYYITITSALAKVPKALSFSYSRMIENPKHEVEALANRLNLRLTDKTREILKTVEAKSPKSEDWVARLPGQMGKRILELEQELQR